MIEVNCNDCINCDKKNDRCIPYGSDPNVAVQKCADKGFGSYVTYSEMEDCENGKVPKRSV